MDWFRMYHEFASDAKVQSMPEAMQRRLVMLLCLRCSNTLVTLQDEELAFALRITEPELAETKVLFVRKNFINEDWEIRQWDERQFVSDSSAPRVKKFREKKREEAEKAAAEALKLKKKQDGNVTVTPQNRTDTEQSRTDSKAEHDNTVVAAPEDPPEPVEPASPHAAPMPMREVPPFSLDPATIISVALRRQGVTANSCHPAVQDWATKGVSLDLLTEAVSLAREAKGDETIPPNYLIPIVAKLLNPPAMAGPKAKSPPASRHSNFESIDYSEGIVDGRIT